MKNSERLNEILLVRELRRKLGSFKLMSNEEKAITLKALNDYEFFLETDIKRSINNAKVLEDDGISHDIEIIEVPVDPNRPSYPEFNQAGSYEPLSANIIRIQNVLFNATSSNLPESEIKVFLKALKEYCRSLQNLQKTQENNRANYPELYKDEQKVQVPPEVAVTRPHTPTMNQQDMFNELYSKYKKEEDSKGTK